MARTSPSDVPFTTVYDAAILSRGMTGTMLFVYCLVKGNLPHVPDGEPETQFCVTGSWIEEASEGRVKAGTAAKAMRDLEKLGVLKTVNNPQSGEGAVREFVSPRKWADEASMSIRARAREVERTGRVGSRFRIIKKGGLAAQGEERAHRAKKGARFGAKKERPPVQSPDEFLKAAGIDFEEHDRASVKTDTPRVPEQPSSRPELPDSVKELAAQLEQKARRIEGITPLLEAECLRIALAYREVLERGWPVEVLASQMLKKLNPKINMPERLLISKVRDFGPPPAARSVAGGVTLGDGTVVPLAALRTHDAEGSKTDTPAQKENPVKTEEGTGEDSAAGRARAIAESQDRIKALQKDLGRTRLPRVAPATGKGK